jgi:hypothetical protein
MCFTKGLIAAVLAVSMTSAPVLAQAAAPLSLGDRAGAAMQDGNALMISERQQILAAAVLIAILAAAILLSNEQGDDDFGNPISP